MGFCDGGTGGRGGGEAGDFFEEGFGEEEGDFGFGVFVAEAHEVEGVGGVSGGALEGKGGGGGGGEKAGGGRRFGGGAGGGLLG